MSMLATGWVTTAKSLLNEHLWGLLISAPSLGVYYFFVVDSVCPSVCLSQTVLLLFRFSMESSHFMAISSP